MVQRASVKGIPQSVLDNFPEVYGTAPVEEETAIRTEYEVQAATGRTSCTRKPLTEVEEVLERGLQLFVE